ncbi:MAG: glycosyl hydrolase family 8 [Candidatus Solibacter sp.]
MRISHLLLPTLTLCLVWGAAAQAQRPPAGDGALAAKRYRNLFLENGHTQKEISQKIDAAFQQLFHGDKDTQTVYYEAGKNDNGPLGYVSDINNKDVRSEGMSYAMMIAVQMNKKAEFDALWNWSMTYMYQSKPTHPSYGYFSWSMKLDGTPNSESPAPDGEEYWATALYFAGHRWGDGKGIYDYRAQAGRLLDSMKNRAIIDGPTNRAPETGGPQFHPEHKMVRFTPNLRRPDHTDPSYHLPAFYELWALWGPVKDRPFWKDAAGVSRDYFQKSSHPVTALTPNYANYDGTPVTTGGGGNANFAADAWRTAANWAVDWSWWAADPRERQLSDKIQAFFESKGIDEYVNRYTLDGTPQGGSHSTALVATNAITSLAATDQARAKKFVEALWKAQIPSGQYRYYDGMWYMMGLLHCAGEFRIWPPK